MNELLPVYIFGEVLYDCFPENAPMLGGAPFNVAWHLQAFDVAPVMISAVGDDALGKNICQQMQQWGLDTTQIQQDRQHPTGTVNVTIVDAEPSYDIVLNAAYDHISEQQLPQIIGEHFFYHGSLAARCPGSRTALERLHGLPGQKTFIDVNLRAPWWDKTWLRTMVHGAYCVKLNQHELAQLAALDDAPSEHCDLEELALNYRLTNNITHLIVTLGAAGAFLVDETGNVVTPELTPQTSNIVDTVGAGDAFSAVLLLGMLHQWDWRTTLERAQQFAGFIVGRQGALSDNPAIYCDFKRLWGLI
ncbi:PfkB family carbohydrate kinase [Shewanella fodinae]|uniref:Fructokinase n=1 Tax=Shewanella fodinae TaxID=552357 RepID=A0A4R2FA28_9GAMM|nr:PfkB family carbohydrate kinase [Shewanella fodinae]TCN83072.1 fructokinase [Shewanella fodinae]